MAMTEVLIVDYEYYDLADAEYYPFGAHPETLIENVLATVKIDYQWDLEHGRCMLVDKKNLKKAREKILECIDTLLDQIEELLDLLDDGHEKREPLMMYADALEQIEEGIL